MIIMAVPRGTSVMGRCDNRLKNITGSRWFQTLIPLSGYGKPEIEAGTRFLDFMALQLAPWELNGVNIMTFLKNIIRDESGASAAEYALILAIVGAGIALAAFNLGGAISGAMNNATNCINNGSTSGTC